MSHLRKFELIWRSQNIRPRPSFQKVRQLHRKLLAKDDVLMRILRVPRLVLLYLCPEFVGAVYHKPVKIGSMARLKGQTLVEKIELKASE